MYLLGARSLAEQPSAPTICKLLADLSAINSRCSKNNLPSDFRQLTAEEEFYLTAGLRWAALKLESLVALDDEKERRAVSPLLALMKETFMKSGCQLPDPTMAADQITIEATEFFKFRDNLVSQAAPHLAKFVRLHRSKTVYFDLIGAALGTTNEATAGRNQTELNELKKYVGLMLTRISGHFIGFVNSTLGKVSKELVAEQFSAAFPGLIHGLARFQPERGLRVSTAVNNWILCERAETIHYERNTIYHRRKVALFLWDLDCSARKLGAPVLDLTDSSLVDALAKHSKLAPREFNASVKLAKAAWHTRRCNHGQREDISREGGVADLSASPVWEDAARSELVGVVRTALAVLPERTAKVVCLRFGLGGEPPKTLKEVGKLLNISDERARQLQNKALEVLKTYLSPAAVDA